MNRLSIGLRNWHEFVEKTAANFHLNDCPRYVTFTHPGMNFSYFDRHTGNPDMVRLMQLLDDVSDCSGRNITNQHGVTTNLMNLAEIMQGNMVFLLSIEYTISRAMYDPTVPKWPLDAKAIFGGFGKTSYIVSQELFIPGGKEPIITSVGKTVLIDLKTRRPKTIPDWLMKNVRGKEMKFSVPRVETFLRPKKTFVYSLKIVNSHTDEYRHVNFAYYARFGLDAVHLALLEKSKDATPETSNSHQVRSQPQTRNSEISRTNKSSDSPLKWISEDILKCGLKKMRISYMSECVEGDTINVHVWQEQGEEFTVRCSIENMDNSVVHSQIIFEYFGPSPDL